MRTGVKIGLIVALVLLLVLGLVVGVVVLGGFLWYRQSSSQAAGVPLVYEIDTDPPGGSILSSTADAVVRIIQLRLDPQHIRIQVARGPGTTKLKIATRAPGEFSPAEQTEIDRLITGPGWLEFRIAVRESDEPATAIAAARRSLRERGPGTPAGTTLHWSLIDASGHVNIPSPPFVLEKWSGEDYVLLYDDPSRILTHDASRPKWSINKSQLTSDPRSGGLALSFGLDPNGASLFGTLTADNLKKPMAILMDDRAVSAPTIQSSILGGQGQITFGGPTPTHTVAMIQKEAETLQQVLNAGSLPGVRLRRIP